MTAPLRITALSVVLAVSLAASACAATAVAPSAPKLSVVLLGDSLAYGTGDEAGKGIGGRLAPELKSRGISDVTATNLGVNGATTTEVAARLEEKDTRAALGHANAIVLSMGANDVRRELREAQTLRAPLELIDEVLRNIQTVVAELHRINPAAHVFILGAYAPVQHERASVLLAPLVAMWDATLVAQFASDPLVEVVRLSDIVDRPERLSRIDGFHPGGDAYQEAAHRIAELIAGSSTPATHEQPKHEVSRAPRGTV
jgi:lysophospholipase L1-like esterase